MATAPFSSVACCKEEENYTRMHMIIQKVCHKVLREYLVKKFNNVAPGVSIDHFLAINRSFITRGRDGKRYQSIYYPLDANNQPIPTNLKEKWDIQMLSFFLTTFCNLSKAEKDDIDFIRKKRNYISHKGTPEVANHLYASFRCGLDGILKQMFSFLGNSSFEKEIKEDLESIDSRLAEHLVDVCRAFHRDLFVMSNKLEDLTLGQSEHRSITESNTEKLKKILEYLQAMSSSLSDDAKKELNPPECSAGKVLVKNCRSPQEEENMTDALMQSSQKNGLNKNIDSPLQSSFKTIEKRYGPATSFARGCIEFAIQFNTMHSCLCYIDDVISGKVDTIFGPLQDALRQSFNNDILELTVIMTEAQFGECFTKMCITLEKALSRSETKSNEVIILPCKTDRSEASVTYTLGPQIVVAIDIGSSYSGYAYSFGQTFCTSKFVSGNSRLLTYKAPTKVLLTPNKLFHKFGFEAEAAYVELAVEGKHKEWFYFENMKMQLYKQKNISRHMEIADVTGKKMEALTVFSMIITYFKEEVLRKLNNMLRVMKHDDIKWVLTVPAIWDDSAKLFMRTAAKMAGINESHLQLGLEAETGSIYCKALALQTPENKLLFPGCRFVVLDLGGGTVDVTAYEVRCDGTLDEIHKAGGGYWGGNMVNDAYIEMLWRIFGKDLVEQFKQDNQVEFLDIQNEFETKKRGFTDAGRNMQLKDLFPLVRFVQELTSSTLPSLIKKAGLDCHISYRSRKLSVSGKMFAELFKTTKENIIGYLQNLLDSAEVHNTIDMLLLFGGFSQSPVVRNALQDAFPHTPIYCPEDAELAVLKGAVIFGHMPSVINSRIFRYSYGIAVMKNAEVGCPAEHLCIDPNGKLLVRNVFSPYNKVGDKLTPDAPGILKQFLIPDNRRSVSIEVYSSSQNEIEYVTNSECIKLGEVRVDCSSLRQQYDEMSIELTFNITEIRVQARLSRSGDTLQCFIGLLD